MKMICIGQSLGFVIGEEYEVRYGHFPDQLLVKRGYGWMEKSAYQFVKDRRKGERRRGERDKAHAR